MFYCKECHAKLKTKTQHKDMPCESSVVNLCETQKDGNTVGYMCNDCNYFQFSRDRLLLHAQNEHGYEAECAPDQFKAIAIVKNPVHDTMSTAENGESHATSPDQIINPVQHQNKAIDTNDENDKVKRKTKRYSKRSMSLAVRKTITDADEDADDANSTLVDGKNTEAQMYWNSPLYRRLCKFCNKKVLLTNSAMSMVQHYKKCHPDREVPISRMSPQMAQELKLQTQAFQLGEGKTITGLCYFCEEEKSFKKRGWQR